MNWGQAIVGSDGGITKFRKFCKKGRLDKSQGIKIEVV